MAFCLLCHTSKTRRLSQHGAQHTQRCRATHMCRLATTTPLTAPPPMSLLPELLDSTRWRLRTSNKVGGEHVTPLPRILGPSAAVSLPPRPTNGAQETWSYSKAMHTLPSLFAAFEISPRPFACSFLICFSRVCIRGTRRIRDAVNTSEDKNAHKIHKMPPPYQKTGP